MIGEDNRSFHQGMAIILASLCRDHDQPSVAIDIMRSNGLSLKDFISAGGIDQFDMKPIRKAWKESS